MTVCVVGLGYIGLPTALMLASHGNRVMAVDYNRALVDTLRHGEVTFEEKGLPELFASARSNIDFLYDYPDADVYIVAVATPYLADSKKVDPQFVCAAVENVLGACHDGSIVVVSPPFLPAPSTGMYGPWWRKAAAMWSLPTRRSGSSRGTWSMS